MMELCNREEATLVNNAMFLFKEAKYTISDTELETVANLGHHGSD